MQKTKRQLDREIREARFEYTTIAPLKNWGIDRALLDELRAVYRDNPKRAHAMARDLGLTRPRKYRSSQSP